MPTDVRDVLKCSNFARPNCVLSGGAEVDSISAHKKKQSLSSSQFVFAFRPPLTFSSDRQISQHSALAAASLSTSLSFFPFQRPLHFTIHILVAVEAAAAMAESNFDDKVAGRASEREFERASSVS